MFLNPKHLPDLKVFHGVFVRGDYATDFSNAVVGDLGAHKAYATAYALQKGARAVIAFEPDPKNFEIAKRTVETFPSDQASLENAAVGGQPGTVQLHSTNESWSHSIIARDDRTTTETVTVRCVSLEDVIGRLAMLQKQSDGGSAARMILKIDIEGSECEALLRTPVEQLSRVDEMFLELHTFATERVDETIEHLKQCGFSPLSGQWERPVEKHVVLHLKRNAVSPAVA